MMENFIITVILILIAGGILCYLIRAKKRGEACIGCPYAKQCASRYSGECNHKETEKKYQRFNE